MENPDLVLQETGSRPTYSRLNYVPSGDTLRRDAISSYIISQGHLNVGHFFEVSYMYIPNKVQICPAIFGILCRKLAS